MHLLPTNYQKSQFCHSILTVWIARQSTSWNYLKSTWITWRPSILNFRCRNSISIWLWCILLTPLGLNPTWVLVWSCSPHSTAWLYWFPYRVFNAVRVKYRKGTYSVTIVTSVPWDMGMSTGFLAVQWAARLSRCLRSNLRCGGDYTKS